MKQTPRLRRIAFLTPLALFALNLLEPAAHALQGGEDPALLPVLVDKRYSSRGRHQISANFSTSVATKFVEGTGAYLTYGYNFTDIFGAEIGGGFFGTRESSIMAEVRQNFPNMEPPLTDLYQMQWLAQADLVVIPIYGKMSFASEFDPSYDVLLLGGGGVAGTKRKVVTGGQEGSVSSVAPTFNFGVGFRFFINRWVGLRLEFRDFFYPEPDPDPTKGGLTHNLMFQGGVTFRLGGDS